MFEDKKIIVYGTGFMADIFMKTLEYRSMQGNVIGVVTTAGGKELFHGFKNERFDENVIPQDTLICVVMHDMYKQELEERLKSKNLNYIWFDSMTLINFIAGEPIQTKRKVSIVDLVRNNIDDYRMAVRWLAIDEYYGKNNSGFLLYKKYWAAFTGENSANKRLEKFKLLIENVEKYGVNYDCPLLVDRNYIICDGSHRFTIAYYRGNKEILCNIYQDLSLVRRMYGENPYLTKIVLTSSDIYTEEEKQLIRNTDKKIRKDLMR